MRQNDRRISLPAVVAGVLMLSAMLSLLVGCPKPPVEQPEPELLSGDPARDGGLQEPPEAEETSALVPAVETEPEGLTEEDLKDIPEEMRPSESTALEAALTGTLEETTNVVIFGTQFSF